MGDKSRINIIPSRWTCSSCKDCVCAWGPECFGWGSAAAGPGCCSQSCRRERRAPRARRFLTGCWRSRGARCSGPSESPGRCSTPARLCECKRQIPVRIQVFLFIPTTSTPLLGTISEWVPPTSYLVLAALSASHQLLPVVVQLLQTHDAVLQTGSVTNNNTCVLLSKRVRLRSSLLWFVNRNSLTSVFLDCWPVKAVHHF